MPETTSTSQPPQIIDTMHGHGELIPIHGHGIQGRSKAEGPVFWPWDGGISKNPKNPLVLIQNQVPDGSTEMVNSRRQNHMFAGRQLRLGP